MTDDDLDPMKALDSVRRLQNAQADRISRGGWLYDFAYSALLAGLVAGWALPQPYNYAAFTVCMALMLLIARAWANHYGVWLSGVSPKAARWVAIGLAAGILPLLVTNMIWAHESWPLWIPVATTLGAFVVALGGSRLWRMVYRRENGLRP